MKPDLAAALDDCLSSMRAGVDLQACLKRYPELADELRPLLQVATDIGAVRTPTPADAARMAGRQRTLAALARKQALRHRGAPVSFGPAQMMTWLKARRIGGARPAWQWAAAAVVVILALVSGTMVASAASLPGDALYPVKLATQQVQVALTIDENAREQLVERFNVTQRQDVQAAMRTGRHAAVELQGTLEQIDEHAWIVSGLPVSLHAETVIIGQPHLGARVVLDGYLPGDGTFVGTRLAADGDLDPVPMATPYPTAQSGKTPRPTATPEPGQPPQPTRGPDPAQTSDPARASEPTRPPQVTHPPKPTHPSRPTKEPKPTKEPNPANSTRWP